MGVESWGVLRVFERVPLVVLRGGMKSSGVMRLSGERAEERMREDFEVLRGLVTGVKPSALTEEDADFKRRGERPSIDFLLVIIYNYSI